MADYRGGDGGGESKGEEKGEGQAASFALLDKVQVRCMLYVQGMRNQIAFKHIHTTATEQCARPAAATIQRRPTPGNNVWRQNLC